MSQICLVCVSLRAGGTERVVSRIANHLCQQHEVTLLLLSNSEPFYALKTKIRLMRPELSRRSQAGWRWYPLILSHLHRGFSVTRPDLVLCFGEPIAPVVLPMARFSNCSVLVFNRASPLTSLKGHRGLLNPLTYPLAERVVVQTQRAMEIMKRRYRLSTFDIMPNPIDVPLQVSPIDQREKRIINVGTLGGKKNQQALIRAFSQIDQRAGWSLHLVGDGPDRTMLEQLVDELKLAESVQFHGQCADVDSLLQDARIFAFSSLTEGFPNALAEAMAAGCACISFDCPTGPSELIQDNISGLLVKNADQSEFDHALDRLVSDHDLQRRLANGARKRICQFSTDKVFKKLDRLIDQVLLHDSQTSEHSCDS